MKKLLRYVMICCMTTVLCLNCFTTSVYAAMIFFFNDENSNSIMLSAEEEALDAIDVTTGMSENGVEVSLFLTTSQGFGGNSAASSMNGYYFNREFYLTLTDKDKRTALDTFVSKIQSSTMISADKQVLYNALKEVDDKYVTSAIADLLNSSKEGMYSAVIMFAPFTSVIGTILGVITILILAMMVVSTVIDLVYIGLPFGYKTDGEKPKLMSKDAFAAVKEYSADGSSGQIYFAYFKRRLITYLLTSLCVLYLVSGNFGDLFVSIVDIFGG